MCHMGRDASHGFQERQHLKSFFLCIFYSLLTLPLFAYLCKFFDKSFKPFSEPWFFFIEKFHHHPCDKTTSCCVRVFCVEVYSFQQFIFEWYLHFCHIAPPFLVLPFSILYPYPVLLTRLKCCYSQVYSNQQFWFSTFSTFSSLCNRLLLVDVPKYDTMSSNAAAWRWWADWS